MKLITHASIVLFALLTLTGSAGAVGSPDAESLLAGILDSGAEADPDLAATALDLTRRCQMTALAPKLVDLAKSGEGDTAARACFTLAELGDKEATGCLDELATHGNVKQRARAATLMQKLGDTRGQAERVKAFTFDWSADEAGLAEAVANAGVLAVFDEAAAKAALDDAQKGNIGDKERCTILARVMLDQVMAAGSTVFDDALKKLLGSEFRSCRETAAAALVIRGERSAFETLGRSIAALIIAQPVPLPVELILDIWAAAEPDRNRVLARLLDIGGNRLLARRAYGMVARMPMKEQQVEPFEKALKPYKKLPKDERSIEAREIKAQNANTGGVRLVLAANRYGKHFKKLARGRLPKAEEERSWVADELALLAAKPIPGDQRMFARYLKAAKRKVDRAKPAQQRIAVAAAEGLARLGDEGARGDLLSLARDTALAKPARKAAIIGLVESVEGEQCKADPPIAPRLKPEKKDEKKEGSASEDAQAGGE